MRISIEPKGQVEIASVPFQMPLRSESTVIARSLDTTVNGFQAQIIAVGVSLFTLVFLWEVAISKESLNLWITLPLLVGALLSDRSFELPFLSGRLHYYQLVIVPTLLVFEPANATLVTLFLLANLLARTWLRFRPHVTHKLLEYLPILLAVWIVGKVCTGVNSYGSLRSLGVLFPLLFVLTGYYLLYTLCDAVRLWLLEPVDFLEAWRQEYLVSTQLVLSLTTGIGLAGYLAERFGWLILLLAIPFVLLATTTYQIYSRNIKEGSRRLSEHSHLQTSIIEALTLAIDAKDHSTHGHVRRVQVYALGIAKSLGIEDGDDLEALKIAALLHDIGKLAIPEYILSKPGKLTDSEFAKMVKHVEIGANILEPIRFPYPVVPIIRHHHERYNGTGYPHGLKGDETPLGSKILSVADTFDALTAHRPYRNPMSFSEAISLIKGESETTYDPMVVKAFLRVAEKLFQQVALIDTEKYANNTHLPQAKPDATEEHKLWLREKSLSEIVQTQREIYSLYEIFQTIGKSLNAEDTMRIICVKLKSLIPYDSCVIYLKQKKSDCLYPALAAGDFAEVLQRNWMNLGQGLTGYAVAFNQKVVNSDPSHDFKNLTYLESPHQLVNSLIFPLESAESVYGAIALYSTVRHDEVYTDDHVRLMETVCRQAAISIQNALSFESYEENSLTDPLTGLPNSRFMFMTFEQNVKKAERFKEQIALLVMDLNHFKEINDQYGHKVGDDVLIKVSQILQREMRKYDVCIRYAGDEFVAFLYNANQETAEKIAGRIKKAVGSVMIKARSGQEVRLGISIGISIYPEHGTDLNQLFPLADSQMYNDKGLSKIENSTLDQEELEEAIKVEDDIQLLQASH
jgi:diguanylate cyclase (GGDEF)-like protein/putative nucleotidyltransferase with HDIG domain